MSHPQKSAVAARRRQKNGDSAAPARYSPLCIQVTRRVADFFCENDYRVTHLLANLGWVDFDLECSTILPSCPASSAKFPPAQAESGRGWNSQSHTNQSSPGDASPCTVGSFDFDCHDWCLGVTAGVTSIITHCTGASPFEQEERGA